MPLVLNNLVDDMVASPPLVFQQLQRALENPESSFTDFASIISADPALSARLLKIVNSPFYGFESRVDSVGHALNILGTDQLADLALATGVITQFKGIPKDLIEVESFWRHSIGCAVAARTIASRIGKTDVEQFYLAGILHEIGSLVFFKEAPGSAKAILTKARTSKNNLFRVEKDLLKFSHGDVGRLLLKKWNLPEKIIDAVTFHHEPFKAKVHTRMACVIHVADIIAYVMKLGYSGEPQVPAIEPGVLDKLGLSRKDLQEVSKTTLLQFNDICKAFF